MQIGTNTLLLVLAAALALGLAYVVVAAPQIGFGGGLNAASGCGMTAGSCSGGNIEGTGTAASAGSGNAASAGSGSTTAAPASGNAAASNVQNVYVKALGGANFGKYDVNVLRVKAGVPVRLHFTAEPTAGCGRMLVIYGLNVRVTSTNGEEEIAEFTPTQAGTYDYSCGMRMFGPGKLIVE